VNFLCFGASPRLTNLYAVTRSFRVLLGAPQDFIRFDPPDSLFSTVRVSNASPLTESLKIPSIPLIDFSLLISFQSPTANVVLPPPSRWFGCPCGQLKVTASVGPGPQTKFGKEYRRPVRSLYTVRGLFCVTKHRSGSAHFQARRPTLSGFLNLLAFFAPCTLAISSNRYAHELYLHGFRRRRQQFRLSEEHWPS
jgi:hypothetical protein